MIAGTQGRIEKSTFQEPAPAPAWLQAPSNPVNGQPDQGYCYTSLPATGLPLLTWEDIASSVNGILNEWSNHFYVQETALEHARKHPIYEDGCIPCQNLKSGVWK